MGGRGGVEEVGEVWDSGSMDKMCDVGRCGVGRCDHSHKEQRTEDKQQTS